MEQAHFIRFESISERRIIKFSVTLYSYCLLREFNFHEKYSNNIFIQRHIFIILKSS